MSFDGHLGKSRRAAALLRLSLDGVGTVLYHQQWQRDVAEKRVSETQHSD